MRRPIAAFALAAESSSRVDCISVTSAQRRVLGGHREREPRRVHAAEIQDARRANRRAIGAPLRGAQRGVGAARNRREARFDVRER